MNPITSLSYNGYGIVKTSLTDEDTQAIKKDLTVSPYVPKDYAMGKQVTFKLFQESKSKIYVPRNYGLSKYGPPIHNKVQEGKDIDVEFTGHLRPEQEAPVKAVLDACNDESKMGGILNLACASGKTVQSIYIICKLAKKTMVVVHKDFLLQQWKERILEFAPNARVGLIKGKIVDVEDKDIVLASLQSLSMKDYTPSVFADFGFVVVDECHHTSAEVFSQALKKVCFKYSLGLSATIKRKDGLTKVFLWYLGNVVYSVKKRKDTVKVHLLDYYDSNPSYSVECFMMKNKLNVSKMLNNICSYEPRVEAVVSLADRILQEEPNRRLLVLSDRRNNLEIFYKVFTKRHYECGYYVGGMKQEDMKESEQKKIILATYAIAAEGFDVKGLDTLILASPKSDIIQSVGRILREKEEDRKHIPIIIDIVDRFSLFEKQAKKRIAYYKSNKYRIEGDTLDEESINHNNVKLDGHCIVELD